MNIIRFFIYALKFERAYKTNNWNVVRNCFDVNAFYAVEAPEPFGGKFVGIENILNGFEKSVNDFDKKFEKRSPRLTKFPRVDGDTVYFNWSVKYTVIGAPNVMMKGSSEAAFLKGKIVSLIDKIPVEVCQIAESYYYKFNP
jgi:hypothetical protein